MIRCCAECGIPVKEGNYCKTCEFMLALCPKCKYDESDEIDMWITIDDTFQKTMICNNCGNEFMIYVDYDGNRVTV